MLKIAFVYCVQDTFGRALGQARATIGYIVCKFCIQHTYYAICLSSRAHDHSNAIRAKRTLNDRISCRQNMLSTFNLIHALYD